MKEIFPFYAIGDFINQPGNPTEFEIMRFEEMEEPDVADIHKHTFYEIIWIETGESKQVIDHKSYEMSAGSLFFISPGQIHEFEEWKPVTGGSIMFTADFYLLNRSHKDQLFELTFLDNVYADPALTLNIESFKAISPIIDLIWAEHKRENSQNSLAQDLLHVLLSYIQRFVTERSTRKFSKRNTIIFKNFKGLLDEHFLEDWSATEYAGLINITQHYLNSAIKQVTGKTTSEVIRERRILEAKRLLTFTDMNVSEIAHHLNYLDPSYFARLFKQDTKVSPVQFRNSLSEKYRKT